MKLPTLLLMVTGDCNFNCKYCYQTREKSYMNWETAKKALDFFLPHMEKDYRVGFVGGEPFLAFGLIKKAAAYLDKKNKELAKSVSYAVNTNGSLLDKDKLDFLQQRRFELEISFDGFKQDWGRRKRSFDQILATIKEVLKRPGIKLETASTFTPRTVNVLSKSLAYIIGLGVQKASFSLDMSVKWNRRALKRLAKELADLREFLLKNYAANQIIPVRFFRKNAGKFIRRCSAGSSQLLVTMSGQIWGCPLFYEYFKGQVTAADYRGYCFGRLPGHAGVGEAFPANSLDFDGIYGRVLGNYGVFRADNFYSADSPCFLCPLVEQCSICPVIKPDKKSPLLFVPSYLCEISKILIAEKEKFTRKLEAINKAVGSRQRRTCGAAICPNRPIRPKKRKKVSLS